MVPGNNMMQFMGMLKNGGNPEQMMMSMLENGAQNNPIMQNLFILAKNKDSKQIEQVARNMAKERGLDFDKEFNSFKQMFGL